MTKKYLTIYKYRDGGSLELRHKESSQAWGRKYVNVLAHSEEVTQQKYPLKSNPIIYLKKDGKYDSRITGVWAPMMLGISK